MTIENLVPLSQLALLPMPRSIEDTPGCLLSPGQTEPAEAAPPEALPVEGYRLTITPEGVTLEASDDAGFFYGHMTLRQLRRLCPEAAPCGVITDAPAFPRRGVMIDISRDKVPTLDTLYTLIDMLAEWKFNHLELYTEHTFAYHAHETVWKDASPMSAQDIQAIDAYCRERLIDLVPNQNSFGHVERWLKHPEYKHLAECPDGFDYTWGGRSPCGSTLDPANPASLAFLDGLFDELLPNFSSDSFNVGCDETWELGKGRSKALCEARGKGRVYLDFLLAIHERVKRHGRRMHFWGDVILHHPELISELPKDIVALNWGYEANHPFEEQCTAFANSGIPFFVCPGTSSWLSIGGRTLNAVANLSAAALAGRKHGAGGYLVTDWGDRGHWQYLPISYLGFGLAAALAWDPEANGILAEDSRALTERIGRHAFRAPDTAIGSLFYDLGNVHAPIAEGTSNGNVLFRTFNQFSLSDDGWLRVLTKLGSDRFVAVRERIAALPESVDASMIQRADARIVAAEFAQARRMLAHACERALVALEYSDATSLTDLSHDLDEIMVEHRRLWLARNRPGGLPDSLAYMENCAAEYRG